MDLFDVMIGIQTPVAGPRPATDAEVSAYLKWLAVRRGVCIDGCELGTDGVWRGHGTAKTLVLAMPGYGVKPSDYMETLDDAGDVVRRTPVVLADNGKVTLSAAQIKDATGLKAVRKARKPAATPRKAVPAPRRTESERRAILRAWRLRCEMRERADLDRRALLAVNEANRMLLGLLSERDGVHHQRVPAAPELVAAREALAICTSRAERMVRAAYRNKLKARAAVAQIRQARSVPFARILNRASALASGNVPPVLAARPSKSPTAIKIGTSV